MKKTSDYEISSEKLTIYRMSLADHLLFILRFRPFWEQKLLIFGLKFKNE